MNVEIGSEVAQFPEKEYIYGIFLAVYYTVVYSEKTSSTITFVYIDGNNN